MSNRMLLAQNEFAKKSTIWLLFLFFGWSYGGLGKIGSQIFFYLTLGGLGIWALIRFFTLNSSIKEFNRNICIKYNLSTEEMKKLGVL